MNIRDTYNTYKDIYTHFGEEAQLDKLLEEANELVEAVKEGDREHIVEELADVIVMINQIQSAFGIHDLEIQLVVIEKTQRTLERIQSRYYENRV